MLAILALCLATDPDLVDLHQEESDMDSAAKVEKQKFADDAAWDPMQSITAGDLRKEQQKLSAAHDLPVYSDINDAVRAELSSLVQTKDAPDDGFAKVETKLQALEEKMKADAAKFDADAEAKAPASSFVQTKDAPDDGFAKVEAKVDAPHRGYDMMMAGARAWEKKHPLPHEFHSEDRMKKFEEKIDALRKSGDQKAKGEMKKTVNAEPMFSDEDIALQSSLMQTKDSPAVKQNTPQDMFMAKIQDKFDKIDQAEQKAKAEIAEEKTEHASHKSRPSSFAQMPFDDTESALDFQEKLGDVRSELKDEDNEIAGTGSSLVDVQANDPGALTTSVPGSAVDFEKGLDLDSPAFQALLMGGTQASVEADGSTNLRKA